MLRPMQTDSQRPWKLASFMLLALTVAQLAAGAFLDVQQFEGKAFGTRLVAYPLLMLLLPGLWMLVARMRGVTSPTPWDATAFVMWGFFVDVTGNSLDLYDTLVWWDDANHFANWVTLNIGLGLCILRGATRPPWLIGIAVAGLGAILAIGWEAAEWFTFIRHGTELDTAYEDTLGDEVLGTLGATVAAIVVARIARRRPAIPQG